MSSYAGAITEFNPYIQQIPTEAYTKVGMFKQQQYDAGVAKIQDTVDKIAGLDIANEGGRAYLQSRVNELTNTLNKYNTVDFSNPNNVAQLSSLAKPLYQDENIINDVVNTSIYRKWSKDASDAYKSGKMELGQYMRESTDANQWLTSQSAGASYTGRQTPNTATKKDLTDRIIKAKKDGMEKNEFVYDTRYSPDTPYYVKSTQKYYSEADFNNFVANNLMSSRDREMLMNDHWYENQGVSTQALQLQDISMYTAKIDQNNLEIDRIKNLPDFLTGDAKTEYQQKIQDLTNYNKTLKEGKIDYLKSLNLADPSTRDVFHRDLSEARYVSSLDVLRDQVKKEEYQKNEQWFKDKELQIELAKEAAKSQAKAAEGKTAKAPGQEIDEVGVYTPVQSNAPKTEVSLNTIQRGYQIKNNEINQAMEGLIGKMEQNGVDMSQFISGWDQVQVGTKGGASQAIPRWKSEADKQRFYNLVSGLDYMYNIESSDGKMDNKSFTDYVKTYVAGYNDDDPNSKFTFADKMISDALNTLKGTSALLPRMENLFADKTVVKSLAQIDSALKDKKDMSNAYREALLKSGALTTQEVANLKGLTDDQLINNTYYMDSAAENRRFASQGKWPVYTIDQDSDGSWSINQHVLGNPGAIGAGEGTTYDRSLMTPEFMNKIREATPIEQSNKLASGYKTRNEAYNDWEQGGTWSATPGISKSNMEKANDYIKKTYSYVQENMNFTVENLKNDKDSYAAVQDGLTLWMNSAKLQATTNDFSIENGTINPASLTGITKVDVLGATMSNTEDLFNPNPMYNVQFTATTGQGTKEEKSSTYNGQVSLKSFLAANPNYRTTKYAKYFAPMLYAQKDGYAMIKAAVNPLEGSFASYNTRNNIEPVYNSTNQQGKSQFFNDQGTDFQWETIPVERDGRQTMISYQVQSAGQSATLANQKSPGSNFENGAFYVKLRVPTSTGQPKVIYLKRPSGESMKFDSAAKAHYTIRDLIFNNPDVKFDEVDARTGQINYLTVDPSTLRGIFNSQLAYNGYSTLETVKIKDALGKEVQKQQIAESSQAQFTR